MSYSSASMAAGAVGAGQNQNAPPCILLLGARRAGKSSIQKVVFQKMSPHETLFLESTNEVRVKDVTTSALVRFQLVDFPGNYDFQGADKSPVLTANVLFGRVGVIVFVIDAQDDESYGEAVDYFVEVAKLAYSINPHIGFDVLIHKVDGDSYLSNDHKGDCQMEIQQQIADELDEFHLPIAPHFHLTSIYDHSVFEAFSKIVQTLIPQLPMLEQLLDSLIASCDIEKAFLFDVVSKIYVATDSNPVDMQTYELCSDMIDVVIDVSCIYGLQGQADGLAYDAESASVIRLSNDYVLYLREANKYLALVCLMRKSSYAKAGLVDYNVAQFKTAMDAATAFQMARNGVGSGAAAAAAAGAAPQGAPAAADGAAAGTSPTGVGMDDGADAI